jgi:hypothetical protein
LLESEHKVARLERASAYPPAVVVAEALLVDRRSNEGDVSSFVQQVLGVC